MAEKTSWHIQMSETNCNHCDNIIQKKQFLNLKTGERYKNKHFINCNSTYVVYRLTCPCECFYVGCTKRRLKDRVAEHKYAIRTNNADYPMARHFNSHHNGNDHLLKVEGIDMIEQPIRGGDRLKKLLQRETFWIFSFEALTHPGLNEEVDFRPFL